MKKTILSMIAVIMLSAVSFTSMGFVGNPVE